MKKCSKCNELKPATLEYFGKHTSTSTGLSSWCRSCKNGYEKQIYNPNYRKEERKEWTINNIDRVKQNIKRWGTEKQGIYEWYEGDICLYVGQSTWLRNRIQVHKTNFNNPEFSKTQKQFYLYELLRQHQNPQIRIIEECLPEILLEREQYYIDTKKPLYNRDNNESNK